MAGLIRVCPQCGQRNRIRAAHLARNVRCGACKADLGPLDHPVDADATLFDEVVGDAAVPVLVDFWAEWCAPCRMAAPEVSRVAKEMAGKAVVLKVDTDRHGDIGARYSVRGIPNFVILKDGRTVVQQAGVVPYAQLKRWLESV
jgi:thioredoxin 2